jgi:hypothetical protein
MTAATIGGRWDGYPQAGIRCSTTSPFAATAPVPLGYSHGMPVFIEVLCLSERRQHPQCPVGYGAWSCIC